MPSPRSPGPPASSVHVAWRGLTAPSVITRKMVEAARDTIRHFQQPAHGLLTIEQQLIAHLEVCAGHVGHYASMPHAASSAYKDAAAAWALIRKAKAAQTGQLYPSDWEAFLRVWSSMITVLEGKMGADHPNVVKAKTALQVAMETGITKRATEPARSPPSATPWGSPCPTSRRPP